MPIDLEIIRAKEFVRLGATGHFDLTASKEVLALLARACRKRGLEGAVLDLRELEPLPKPRLSPEDLLQLVNTFTEVGFSKRLRLAILYRSDPHKRARLFSFLGSLHGWNVRAFGSFEHAVTWLSQNQEAFGEATQSSGEQPVAVRVGRRGTNGPARTLIRARGAAHHHIEEKGIRSQPVTTGTCTSTAKSQRRVGTR
jgi:hypothetical protein